MDWKLGDFVRFVDERHEGYVTRIFDNGMVGVTGDDDFEIPVPANKITTVHGRQGANTNSPASVEQAADPAKAFVKSGIYMAVVNDPKAVSVVHFHLVNETSFKLLVAFTTGNADKIKGEWAGIVEPKSQIKIYAAQLADIQIWPLFNLQVLFYTPHTTAIPKPLIYTERFKAKDFSGGKKTIPSVNQAGWLFRLDEQELIIDPEKLKESFFKPAEEKQEIEKPLGEVDLHIEKLRDDHQFMQASEILAFQLYQFHKTLDAAIVHKLTEIVFIHGAGNGILRHEIHKQLGKHPKVTTFMDARKEKFGFGATRVVLK